MTSSGVLCLAPAPWSPDQKCPARAPGRHFEGSEPPAWPSQLRCAGPQPRSGSSVPSTSREKTAMAETNGSQWKSHEKHENEA